MSVTQGEPALCEAATKPLQNAKKINYSPKQLSSTVDSLLYPARSRWGTYRGYCSRRDGARTSVKTWQAAHTRNNPHVKLTGVY
jgi:hypothetical protein